MSGILVLGLRERGGESSQLELVMSGGVLSLGLAAGGPLQASKGPWYKKGPLDKGITLTLVLSSL